jgi:3-deoxy-D-manno-octulosonic-acid transferase
MIKFFKKKNNYAKNKKKIFDLIKRKYGEYYIFITANSIGEVFTICALIHEFKKI